MARQSFFIESPALRVAAQFEFVFSCVENNTSSAVDRAQLLEEIRAQLHQANQPKPQQASHQPKLAQPESSLIQPSPTSSSASEPVNANDLPALAPAVAKKPRAKELKPSKNLHRLIPAAGTTEKETGLIITEEEWVAFFSAAPVHQHGDRTAQAYVESP